MNVKKVKVVYFHCDTQHGTAHNELWHLPLTLHVLGWCHAHCTSVGPGFKPVTFWTQVPLTWRRSLFLKGKCINTSDNQNQPTNQPTDWPTNQPTNQPTNRPADRPKPTNRPTNQPTNQKQPTNQNQLTDRPTNQAKPTNQPKLTNRPTNPMHYLNVKYRTRTKENHPSAFYWDLWPPTLFTLLRPPPPRSPDSLPFTPLCFCTRISHLSKVICNQARRAWRCDELH